MLDVDLTNGLKVLEMDNYRQVTSRVGNMVYFFLPPDLSGMVRVLDYQWEDEERHQHMQRRIDGVPYIGDWLMYVRPPKYPPTQTLLKKQIKEWKNNGIEVLDFSFRK